MPKKGKTPVNDCPCGSGVSLSGCCGPLLDGDWCAPTAEALMRSRYTAFVFGDRGYLERTWHSATQPRSVSIDPAVKWVGLRIVERAGGGEADAEGEVAFVARYKVGGRAGCLEERSRFRRENGEWRYLDGE